MRIVHVIETLASSGGGLPAAVKSLMALQATMQFTVSCAVTSSIAPGTDAMGLELHPLRGPSVWTRWRHLRAFLAAIAGGRFDHLHAHGLWNVWFLIVCFACRRAGVPYSVTTHGQLLPTILDADPWSKRTKKLLFHALFGRALLRGAERIHVSSENERRDFARDGALAAKVMLIPHFIDRIFLGAPAEDADTLRARARGPCELLFVGRLDARKGVLDLIDAFGDAPMGPHWRLRIVGPVGEQAFFDLMQRRITERQLGARVSLAAPVYGDARLDLYRACHVLCLPSYSEAPGLVNIEAALCGRPVLTTPHTGLFDIADHGGMLSGTGRAALAAALSTIAAWSPDQYAARSAAIRAWAQAQYADAAIMPSWRAFYRPAGAAGVASERAA